MRRERTVNKVDVHELVVPVMDSIRKYVSHNKGGVMNGKRLLNLIFVLTLLLSSLVSVTLAQEPEPQAEELGSVPGIDSPPEVGIGESTALLATAFSGGPDYDSGWVSLAQDEAKTLTHNLGGDTDDYVVDMQYKYGSTVNQRYYGGADFGAKTFSGTREDDRVGAYWRTLTTSSIIVYRRPEDTYAEQVRIRIWVDPYPDYDSGWTSLGAGAAVTTLTHSLGGNADDYVVDMQYRYSGNVNQRYYGGADFGATAFNGTREDERVGLYWRSLNNSTIALFRRAEDDYAAQVRIRIWVRPTPTYDSGWVSVNQDQAKTLTHNIGGNPEDYVVDLQYKYSGNVNQRYYGGADFGANPPSGMNEDDRVGAYWRSLSSSSIAVYRRPEDIYAPQVRIRIWCFWKPPVPDYDSGWVSLGAGASATTLTHNLGGDADDYFVDMQYKYDSNINRRYYGGADFGVTAFSGTREDDRVGAYWRSLDNSTITVFRRAEDDYAPEVRIRIWRMPKPDYDSGWTSLTAGAAATTLSHNLGGDYLDYLVDMQYRTSAFYGRVNQRYYGGADFGANPPSDASENDRQGAYWRSLDLSSITVYRRPEDIYAPEVRIRIWRTAQPDYESGWQVVGQDATKTLSHNLGGNAENYLVNMIYYDTLANYVNQRHLGGADFGANPPSGYNADDRVGAYWRSLTDSSITVYRRPEDGFADYLRIRIWVTPYRVYLPLVTRNY